MLTLLDLPDGIVYMIGKEIPDNRRIDRYRLATCSRRLFMVLSPIVFSHVTLCGELETPQIRHVSSFLHAVVRNPKLADLVEYLELHCWKTGISQYLSEDLSEVDFEYDAELIRPIVNEASDSCSDEVRNKWHKHVESGVTDAWLALLIPRLTKLRKISLVWPYKADYVPWMLREAATAMLLTREWASASASAPVFPYLEEAYATWYDTEGAASSTLMHPFFAFPAMRKIEGYKLAEDDDEYREDNLEDDAADFLAPRSSAITRLDLMMSNCAEDVSRWVRACKTSKSFRYSHGGTTVSDDEFLPGPIHQSLLLHRTTLESVWVSPGDEPGFAEDVEFIGSFADFTASKHLHLSLSNLADVDMDGFPRRKLKDLLPSFLETLYLCDCQGELLDWAFEQLENLVGSGSVSSLKKLALEGQGIENLSLGEITGDEDSAERMGPLKGRCEEAGVSFATFVAGMADIWRSAEETWLSSESLFHDVW